jgi:hypothetical protein
VRAQASPRTSIERLDDHTAADDGEGDQDRRRSKRRKRPEQCRDSRSRSRVAVIAAVLIGMSNLPGRDAGPMPAKRRLGM